MPPARVPSRGRPGGAAVRAATAVSSADTRAVSASTTATRGSGAGGAAGAAGSGVAAGAAATPRIVRIRSTSPVRDSMIRPSSLNAVMSLATWWRSRASVPFSMAGIKSG